MFLFVINTFVHYSPGGKFFTPFIVVKLVIYPGFSNALSETLRTYTFLVWSLSGVNTDNFQHWYTNFEHTNLGMPKFNLKSYLNYQKDQVGKKTSLRCLKDVLWRHSRHLGKMSFRHLKNVGFANLEDILHSYLKDISCTGI